MKTRSSDVASESRGKRKAPEGDENGRGKRRSVVQSSNDQKIAPPQREENGRAKRKLIPSNGQRNGKILRGIHGCVSPRCSAFTYRPSFSWYEQDIWTCISKILDGKSLVKLGATNKWFHKVTMEQAIWRFICLRDLQVPQPYPVSSSWIKIYASAFNGSHSYLFRHKEKHIDWMRIGAFTLDSQTSLLTESLKAPLKLPRGGTIELMLQNCGSCIVKDIKSGIWNSVLSLFYLRGMKLNWIGLRVSSKIIAAARDVQENNEIYAPYNILPLDSAGASQSVMQLEEVKAAVAAVGNTRGLNWPSGFEQHRKKSRIWIFLTG